MRIFESVPSIVTLFTAISFAGSAQMAPANGGSLESALQQQLNPAQTAVTPGAGPQSGTTVINPGNVFVVRIGGLQGAPPFRFDKVVCASTYQNGVIHPPSGFCNSMESAGTRFWNPGTKVYVYKFDVSRAKNTIDLNLIECDTCNGVAGRSSFKARVSFQFVPGFLDSASPAQVMGAIGQVIGPDQNTAQSAGASDGQAPTQIYAQPSGGMPATNPQNQTDQDGHAFVVARDFTFALIGCKAESSDVYCTMQVTDNSEADHDLIIVGPPSSCCSYFNFSGSIPTQIVDPSGGVYAISDLRLANNASSDTERLFRVLSGIKYSLMLHFVNVGVNLNTISRLLLVAGEHLDGEQNTTSLPLLFRNIPILRDSSTLEPPPQNSPAMTKPAGNPAEPLQARAAAVSGVPSQGPGGANNVIDAKDFQFTNKGCKAESTDVYCTLQVVNNSAEDHDLIVQGPMSSCCMYFHFATSNPTQIIDPLGGVHPVSDLRLSNNPTNQNQTVFRVLAGIKYPLLLHFQNIGVDINSIARLSIIVGEHLDGENVTTPLPVLFRNVPILRGSTEASKAPPISPNVDKRFVVATPDWRIISRGCNGAFGEIHCTLQVANLRDIKGQLYIGGRNRRAIVVDEDGNTFQSVDQFVKKEPGLTLEGGGIGNVLTFDPYKEVSFDLIFSGVTATITQITRFDPELATSDNGQVSVLPAKFTNVAITSLPPKIAAAHVSGKVITAQQEKAQEAFELLLIGWAVSALASESGSSSADQTHNDRCKIVDPFDKTKCTQTWMQWSQQQKQQ